ncbi:hypothetical protein D3C76_1762130 [compost metagenome]
MKGHLSPDTPYVRDRAFLKYPVALGLVTKVDDTTTLSLPLFCRMIGEFAQGLRAGDTYTNGDAGAPIHQGSDTPTERL